MENDKFKALVHLIVHHCRDNPGKLGATRLNKALWFMDVFAYKMWGHSISNGTYRRRKNGPVPSHILAALRDLVSEDKVLVQEPEYLFEARKYISLLAPDSNHLSAVERGLAKSMTDAVCGFTTNEISEITHDIIWEAALEGEEIPLYATLAAYRGEITDEAKKWAYGIVEGVLSTRSEALRA